MNTKCNNNQSKTLIDQLISNDDSIEFFGIKHDKSVRFIQNGKVYYFNNLSAKHFILLHNAYRKDKVASSLLKKQYKDNLVKQVEAYTYFCYGALDHTPDIINGVLQPAENFRHRIECVSLRFESKKITIENKPLTPRELQIIDLVAQDYPDKYIAGHLGIKIPTLNTLKSKLFKKVNVQTKVGLLKKAIEENIPVYE